MSNAPERIWATVNGASTSLPSGTRQLIGGWSETSDRPNAVEYVRADAVVTPLPSDLKVTGFRGNPTRVVLSNGQEATIAQKLIDAFATPSPLHHVELPQDVINLVIAAREFWDDNNDLSPESDALDKALEPFSSRVPYENEPENDR